MAGFRHTLLTLLLLLTTLPGVGAIEFRTLSVNDGLSQSTVLAITQDPLGRIWMGTQDGLNCYDGYDFTVYRHVEGDPNSIDDDSICALLCEGRYLWVGTSWGLSCYDASTQRFENFRLDGYRMQVSDIALQSDGNLLLATDLGIVLFDRRSRTLEIRTYLKGISVHTICPSPDGFLVGTSDGVYTYSSTYGNAIRVLPQMARFDVASIVAADGGYWVATHGNGLYRLDENLQVVARYSAAANPGLVSDYIRVLRSDSEGRLWIGTFDGLSILDPSTGRFDSYVYSSRPGSLSHNSIRSIFIDNQRGVWLGTYYGGVSYYHPLARRFGVLSHDPARNSLGDNTVSCIVEDPSSESLWIGTNDDGVNRYDRRTGRFEEYNAASGSLLSNNVKCILPDGRGHLWIGTHAGGLTRMDLPSRRTQHYQVNASIPINNSCYALLEEEGRLWVGTLNGLLTFDPVTGRFAHHPCTDYEPRLRSLPVTALFRDSQQRVWIGTQAGLYCWDPACKRVLACELTTPEESLTPSRLREIVIFCIMEDSHHSIWVGTRQGLYRFDSGTTRFRRYAVADGLPNDVVYGIVEDELSRLWISTNDGLACFDIRKETFRNYTLRDGIANNQFNPYAYCRSRDGIFWFGGLGGITWFRPHDLVDNPFAPVARITDVAVTDAEGDRRVRIDRDSVGQVVQAAFPSVRNIFSIRFVAVNPLAGGRNTFAYKLEGFNTRWYETTRLEANYSNLKPGRYLFKVRAANNDGRWSDEVATVRIRVLPMWWQTLGARLLWVVLALGAIGGVISAIAGRMRMKVQLQMERLEKESIEELSQEKIRFYINLSHELRTPLSLILSPLQEIRAHGTSDKYISSRLDYIHRNSLKLLHLINQLLDYRKAELGMFRMRVAVQDVDAIVAEVFSLFEEVAQNRDMDYILSSELKGESLPVDRMFLEMMLTNLLSNAFKFTPDGGMIRVALLRGEGCFRLQVRDNGIGITPEQQTHIFERFYQGNESSSGSGIGLSIVQRIVELHQGTITLRSEPGSFTEFTITLSDDPESYPPEKRARENDVRASIIRDAEKSLPEAWLGEEGNPLPPEEEDEEKRGTLLIAEADAEVARYMTDYFRKRYRVVTAADGNEALEQLKTLEPDLIIADRMLPGVDGLKLCQTVKQNIRTCHIPVVILAPEGGVEEQITGIEAGADSYLPMPLSITLLAAKVRNLLKSRYRMRHHYSDDTEIDPDKITSNAMDGEFLKKAIRIVEENLDNEEFSSNDFSKALCMSRSNLHLKMKSITGESATKFIRKIRFNRACRLLLERKYSIAEISSMVGFNSPSYFATSFKKHVGCLPTEYLRNHARGDRDPESRESHEGRGEGREEREERGGRGEKSSESGE